MKEKLRSLILGNGKNLGHKTYLWTVTSGLMYAGSSVIMLWAVTQILGAAEGGVYSICFAVSQQLLTLGWYCMRTFQASDIQHMYAFKDYFASRIITVGLMMLAGMAWVLFSRFTLEKAALTLIFCLYRGGEAFSDVFEGLYQQKGRYDLSAKGVFIKYLVSTSSFIIALYVSKNLIVSACCLVLAHWIVFLVYDSAVVSAFESFTVQFRFGHLRRLLLACLPLFIGSFLSGYINNSAKYAIDAYLASEIQTYFNILFMPAFVINLFGGFILKPQLSVLATQFGQGQVKKFLLTMGKQIVYTLLITLVCMTGGYLFGIPVLSWFYGVELEGYRGVLMVLLAAGGVSALYGGFYYCITLMRRQYMVLVGYGSVFLLSLVLMPFAVRTAGLVGAAWGYLLLMIVMNGVFALVLAYYLYRLKKYGNLRRHPRQGAQTKTGV